jgi:hypothetical protein
MDADADPEFEYIVAGWLWAQKRASVLRTAREQARRRGMSADGDPVVHVVLVWPQDLPGQPELPLPRRRQPSKPATHRGTRHSWAVPSTA